MNRLSLSFLAVVLASGLASAAQNPAPTQPSTGQPAQTESPAFNKAAALLREGRTQEALAILEEEVKRNPSLMPPRLILARISMRVAPQQTRWLLEQAANATPDHPDIYLTNGEIALSELRISDAILNAIKALELANAPRWAQDQRVNFHKTWDPLESTCRHASLSIL